jgi:type II secretory pathway pseudopilin PulG
MTADDKFCRVCGRMASADSAATAPSGASASGIAETSGKAIGSLICGLLFFIPFLFVAAIVFGHLALSEIRKSGGRLKGEGLAIAGLVFGYIWIVAVPIVLIIAAIAIPNLLRARTAANEASAVASVRMLVIAETSYATAHPGQGYTCSLPDLAADQSNVDALATGQKSGYAFELTGCTPAAEGGPNAKYQVLAYPLRVNQTGTRAFCSDESGVVKIDYSASARGCLENGSAIR